MLIESTVQEDKKLILLTSIILKESSTGFIITPPPIPQIAPIDEASKLTIKKKTIIFWIICVILINLISRLFF